MPRILMAIGLVIFLVGLAWYFAPWLLNWFGKLPGDIRIERENTKIFIPITSMVLVSLLLSIVLNLFQR
jgi:Na+-driven multidrug efflux pump